MNASAVILTREEEANIGTALRSVEWCDEVFVVDSRSTDRTREIARSFGSTVIDAPRPQPGEPYDQFRRLGADVASNDMLLLLDADESLPVDLQHYLRDLRVDDEVSVVRAPVLNYLSDELLTRGWPRYKPIAVRRDAATFGRDVHDFLRIEGRRVDELDDDAVYDVPATHRLAVSHHVVDSVYERLVAQRRYARIAGAERRFSVTKLLLAPPWGVYNRLVEQRGWRDGLVGVGLALCYAWFLFESQLRAGIQAVRD